MDPEWQDAWADAVVRANPGWPRGHSRRGNALHGLCRSGVDRWADARSAYLNALELQPGNETVKKALEDLETEASKKGGAEAAEGDAEPQPAEQQPAEQ